MAKSKVNSLDSTVHAPRTIVHLTVNAPSIEAADPVIAILAPPEEVLAVIAEIRQANPRNQPMRYETLQRWAEVLEHHFTPS